MIPRRTKIFIGSLQPNNIKPEELRRLFENYGVVTECDIMNRCGFVHMETEDMAENAIKALNNTNFKGSTISVEPGRMKDRNDGSSSTAVRDVPSKHFGGGRGGGGGGPSRGSVGNQNSHGGGDMRGNGGPMRRDRATRGAPPYNRNSGTGGFQERFQGGPRTGRSFDSDLRQSILMNGTANNMGNNFGSNGGSGSSNFGMGNQDKRGFALPERQPFHDGPVNKRIPLMGGGGSQGGGMGGGGNQGIGMRGNNQIFERRPPGNAGFNNNNEIFNRRPSSTASGNMNMGNGMFGRGQGFNRDSRGGGAGGFSTSNYSQSFPPLGGRGGGGNRNGPPRRGNMMSNQRY